MTRARSLMAGAVVLLSSTLFLGCGKALKTCASNNSCKDISGSYGVDTSQVQGTCDFTPYTLPSTITVQQSAQLDQVTLDILDQVSQQQLELKGPLYAPDSSKAQGTISLTRQTTRLKTAQGTDMANFQIVLSASVTQDGSKAPYVLSGSLATTDLSAGASACTLTVSFSATRS